MTQDTSRPTVPASRFRRWMTQKVPRIQFERYGADEALDVRSVIADCLAARKLVLREVAALN